MMNLVEYRNFTEAEVNAAKLNRVRLESARKSFMDSSRTAEIYGVDNAIGAAAEVRALRAERMIIILEKKYAWEWREKVLAKKIEEAKKNLLNIKRS